MEEPGSQTKKDDFKKKSHASNLIWFRFDYISELFCSGCIYVCVCACLCARGQPINAVFSYTHRKHSKHAFSSREYTPLCVHVNMG